MFLSDLHHNIKLLVKSKQNYHLQQILLLFFPKPAAKYE